jgi:hypothetical protein
VFLIVSITGCYSREQGSRREDDTERLVRLFIVVPKTATEDEVREHFRQFGDLEYVSIVRNRETGESKGFAYVKYHRYVQGDTLHRLSLSLATRLSLLGAFSK